MSCNLHSNHLWPNSPSSNPLKPSNFDAHKPPETALIEDCVHCGFCLPACPTYVLWGEEMDSPRGRIYMMKKSAQGEAPLDQRFRLHMDNCLGCMACMTACPSGVQYNKLIEDTRAQVERNIPRTTTDSLFRKLLFATFPYVKRLRLLALPMLIYQRSGLQKLVRATGLLRLLPKRLAQMEALLPRVPTQLYARPARQGLPCLRASAASGHALRLRAAGLLPAREPGHRTSARRRRLRGGHPPGAAMLRRPHAALRSRRTSLRARAPDDRHLRGGQRGHHRDQRRRLRLDHEGIRPPAARRSCMGSARRCLQRQVQRHLRDSVRTAAPVRRATLCPCAWPTTTLATCATRKPSTPSRGACWPRFPSSRSRRSTRPTLCCGSAGVYNLLNPEPANQLGDRKVENLLATKADAVISANPGCLLQLMSSLRRRGLADMPTFHMVELLDASIRNVPLGGRKIRLAETS